MLPLCRNLCVSFRTQDIQHVAQRRQDAALKHAENSGSAATNQCYTLLILGNRLLLITALDIPEHHPRQLIMASYVRSILK